MVIFDLDGTLVDSKEAVKQAYLRAGVTMPEWAWGRPWREWMTDPMAHALKAMYYPAALKEHGRKLPLYDYASKHGSPVITGASYVASQCVMELWGPLAIYENGLTPTGKVKFLSHNIFPKLVGDKYYVDDDEEVRHLVAKHTRWQVLTPQAAQQLFLPQAPTHA